VAPLFDSRSLARQRAWRRESASLESSKKKFSDRVKETVFYFYLSILAESLVQSGGEVVISHCCHQRFEAAAFLNLSVLRASLLVGYRPFLLVSDLAEILIIMNAKQSRQTIRIDGFPSEISLHSLSGLASDHQPMEHLFLSVSHMT
jgi:hypothetical protein